LLSIFLAFFATFAPLRRDFVFFWILFSGKEPMQVKPLKEKLDAKTQRAQRSQRKTQGNPEYAHMSFPCKRESRIFQSD
jgi:hypothetical protein